MENKDINKLTNKASVQDAPLEPAPKSKDKKAGFKLREFSWSFKILFITIALSMLFGVLSEIVLKNGSLIIAIVLILILFVVGVVFDMIGVACTSCSIEPFMSMASKKEKGAKEGIALIRNADKVSSFCCDIVGDMCGILSGAAGAMIVAKLMLVSGSATEIVISALISSCIAGFVVFGKSIGKVFAVKKSSNIILLCGKFISNFNSNKKQKPKNEK